jgi:hypothetical protein
MRFFSAPDKQIRRPAAFTVLAGGGRFRAYSLLRMRTLSVFEYRRIEPLTGTEKSPLDQLRGPRNERLFEIVWRVTRATSFVGVVQLPQPALQVLPKMYRHEDAKEREATANLLFLLRFCCSGGL